MINVKRTKKKSLWFNGYNAKIRFELVKIKIKLGKFGYEMDVWC
jgi:hypothetical protein